MYEAELLHCRGCRKTLTEDLFKIKKNGLKCKTCKLCSFRKLQYSKRGKRIFDHFMKLVDEAGIAENR